MDEEGMLKEKDIDATRNKFPYCVVWTPLPLISWFIPVIGHMGICTSLGVIRDFAGPYYVSEDNMAFGKPAKYWRLSPSKAELASWDGAVHQASEEYSHRMHNLFCDNCHSHVARAMNLMQYNGSHTWNMFKLWFFMILYGRYVSFTAVLKTWLPFLIVCLIVGVVIGCSVGITR